MRKIVLSSLCIVWVMIIGSAAAGAVSLDQLIDKGYTYNHNITYASRAVEVDRGNIDWRNLFPPPSIELEWRGMPRDGFGNPNGTEVVFSQAVPFPTKLFAKWDILNKQANLSRYDYNLKKQKTLKQIKKAYYQYALNDKLLMYEKTNYQFLEILYKSELKSYEMGYGSQIDLLDLKTRLITASAAAQEYVTAKYNAFAMLEAVNASPNPQILMQEGTRGFMMDDLPVLSYDEKDIDNIPHITKPLEELKNIAISNNPLYQKLRYESEIASMSAEVAQQTYLPDMTFALTQMDALVPGALMPERRFAVTMSFPWLWGSGVESGDRYKDALFRYADYYMTIDEITSSIDGKSTSAYILYRKLGEYKQLLPLIEKQFNQVNIIYSSQYMEPKALETAYNQFMKVNNAAKGYYDIYIKYIELILDVEELTGERIW